MIHLMQLNNFQCAVIYNWLLRGKQVERQGAQSGIRPGVGLPGLMIWELGFEVTVRARSHGHIQLPPTAPQASFLGYLKTPSKEGVAWSPNCFSLRSIVGADMGAL